MARPITIASALLSLRPGAQWNLVDSSDYSTLVWLDQTQGQPSESEVNAEIARLTAQAPLEACSEEAKVRIAATDWSVLPDVGLANVAEFQSYRATLRALILNPVANPSWPTEPTPVWS